MLDDVAGCAAGAGPRDIAMDAGSARTVVAAKPSALTAAEIDLRQAVCMAVLLDFVDRRHPCRRLICFLLGEILFGVVRLSLIYGYCAPALAVGCAAGNTGNGMLCWNFVLVKSTTEAGRPSDARCVCATGGVRPSRATWVA